MADKNAQRDYLLGHADAITRGAAAQGLACVVVLIDPADETYSLRSGGVTKDGVVVWLDRLADAIDSGEVQLKG